MIAKRRPRATRQGPGSETKSAGVKVTKVDRVSGSGSHFTALVDDNCMEEDLVQPSKNSTPCPPAETYSGRESREKEPAGGKVRSTSTNKGGNANGHPHTTTSMPKKTGEPSSQLKTTSEVWRETLPQHGDPSLSQQQELGLTHQPNTMPMDTREAAEDASLTNDPISRDENNQTLIAPAVGHPPNADLNSLSLMTEGTNTNVKLMPAGNSDGAIHQ
ncbi:unnamed protein product [Linum trigynum]|uniref:Uncharacterized protein n=1 Tax=Linum trigynum TaxID=586398 RepID=A0AAV2CKL1_9ROSI